MAGRPPSEAWRKHVSAIIAGALVLGLFSSVALADPAAFGRAMGRAKQTLFGLEIEQGGSRAGQVSARHGQRGTPSADCAALVTALEESHPRSEDVREMARAVEVVRSSCAIDGRGHRDRSGPRASRRPP